MIAGDKLGGETLEEVVGCALVELLVRMLEHSEYDGLRAGEYKGHQPGKDYKQPRNTQYQSSAVHASCQISSLHLTQERTSNTLDSIRTPVWLSSVCLFSV